MRFKDTTLVLNTEWGTRGEAEMRCRRATETDTYTGTGYHKPQLIVGSGRSFRILLHYEAYRIPWGDPRPQRRWRQHPPGVKLLYRYDRALPQGFDQARQALLREESALKVLADTKAVWHERHRIEDALERLDLAIAQLAIAEYESAQRMASQQAEEDKRIATVKQAGEAVISDQLLTLHRPSLEAVLADANEVVSSFTLPALP